MEQFIVPQFLDVEDKIIGPITTRQFLILLVTAALVFLDYEIIYKLTQDFWFFTFSSVTILSLGCIVAFLRVNGRPFHYFFLNIMYTLRAPRLRVWQKSVSWEDLKHKEEKVKLPVALPVKEPLTSSKLARLALIVDTGGAYQEGEEEVILIKDQKEEGILK